jgi:glycosyltransferase involved in cell wall biosynthesis
MKKLSLSVILPLKSAVTKDFADYFTKAIDSIKNQKIEIEELLIVATQEEQLTNFLDTYDFGTLTVNRVIWNETPNFASHVNFGVKSAKGEWVSVLEFDDEYSNIWFENVQKYSQAYPEVQVFLPVVVETDEKGGFAGFTNEATFAANFSQEMGILTNDTLQDYQNFQVSGSAMKKTIFEDFGGIKPNFQLTFIYEFLLRLTYNSVQIMTIPRLGYKHTNMREGSIFWNYKFGDSILSEPEVRFWIQSAKQEYFFTDDRVIKYEPSTI